MTQAVKELILGIELNRSCAQITYYHQSVREPVTLGAASDAEEDRLPMGLRLDGQGEWQLWDREKSHRGRYCHQLKLRRRYCGE